MLKKKQLTEAPLGYWEEKSYMLAIPKDENYMLTKEDIERISSIEGVTVTDTHYSTEGFIELKLEYDEENYEIGIFPGPVSVPPYYLNKNFWFKEEEAKAILEAHKSLTIFMEFKKNAKKSFHLQLKLATALVPDMLALLDESAERVLPAKWVIEAANSKVLPSSKDLFVVQAVEEKDGKVWLHTHGLCRCHTTELEILDSNRENSQNHYNLLNTYAMYILDKTVPFDPRTESAYIGRLIDGSPVVTTCRSWTESLDEYKKLSLGNLKDRKEGHNSKTSVVFLYMSEEDEKNGKLTKVSVYDDMWGDNPLFFYSDEETNRMKALAKERFDYVKKAFKDKDNQILIKIGLPLKEKGSFEHIWFELMSFKGEKFKAKLTQEPYDVPDIHTGDEAWFELADVTDWIIYTKNFLVNPSSVYLLED